MVGEHGEGRRSTAPGRGRGDAIIPAMHQAEPPSLEQVREVAQRAAVLGGRILREHLGKVRDIRHKGQVDLVTEVDHLSEIAISEVIREVFPRHQVLAEEGTIGGDDPEHRWIIDPLDGTTNYAHGFPFFAVSIAYERAGTVEVGVIYNPIALEMFVAMRGQGATLNGQPIAVSSTTRLILSLLATGFPYDRTHLAPALRLFDLFSHRAQAVRRAGSAALDLAYVAAGRFDGYWERHVQPWDIAAGALMVVEAGGQVTNFAGRPFDPFGREIVATNGRIHAAVLQVIAEAEGATR